LRSALRTKRRNSASTFMSRALPPIRQFFAAGEGGFLRCAGGGVMNFPEDDGLPAQQSRIAFLIGTPSTIVMLRSCYYRYIVLRGKFHNFAARHQFYLKGVIPQHMASYNQGAQVEHQTFGLGTVLSHTEERIVIKFERPWREEIRHGNGDHQPEEERSSAASRTQSAGTEGQGCAGRRRWHGNCRRTGEAEKGPRR